MTPRQKTPAQLITARIKELGGWRGKTLARLRAIVTSADARVVEEWKWDGPVWSCDGILCTGEAYKAAVKMTFAHGASLDDPSGLFNSSLGGGTRRAIDFREGDTINEKALTALIRSAVAFNARRAEPRRSRTAPVRLLSGGNPQIPKGDGDAPVQAYIAAMPGWKSAVGRRLDAIIVRALPKVQKAVKWNGPFYGTKERGWFLAYHCLTRYVKVAFFRGAELTPVPPGPSKDKFTRYLDIHEHDPIDEAQFARWVRQASRLPGWAMGDMGRR